MSQFSLFLPSKRNPGVSQYNHIHLGKGDVKDFDYTFAPTQIIDLTEEDDGNDDEYVANFVYVDNNIEEKSLTGNDETEVVTLPQHNPEDYNDITYRNDDQANYENEIIDENLPTTTSSPFIYHIGNTESATEFEGNTFFIENENIDREADEEEPILNYIEDEPIAKLKPSPPNSEFKSDFFNSMNIQNLVFSIPDQFREYLHEPPEWINKDYW